MVTLIRKRFRWIIKICCISLLLYVLYDHSRISIFIKNDPTEFVDFTANRTWTFHTVCLTNHIPENFVFNMTRKRTWYSRKFKNISLLCRMCEHPQKLITVYQNIKRSVIRFRKGSFHSLGFHVQFKNESELPHDYTIIENQTAYFLGHAHRPFEPYNFFHFTKQIFFPLYWLVKLTNQLYEGAHNIVFYPRPYAACRNERLFYYNINQYDQFRKNLHIKNHLELSAFTDMPDPNKVCYKNAVFSTEFFLDKASEATDYFMHSLNVRDEFCKPNILTIINRSTYRRILNVDMMKQVGKELGFDTRVVVMENLTLKEQAQLIHCTSILVGVTGAGLQWAFFMKNHSGVVEIAWPDKEWPFFFTGSGSYHSEERDVVRPLKFVQLNGTCQVNPLALNQYIKQHFFTNMKLPRHISREILENPRNYNFERDDVASVGKMCDVTVDKKAFRKAVLIASRGKLAQRK